MIVRCAWCRCIFRDQPPYGGWWDKEITDGICDDCLKKYFGIEGEAYVNQEGEAQSATESGVQGGLRPRLPHGPAPRHEGNSALEADSRRGADGDTGRAD